MFLFPKISFFISKISVMKKIMLHLTWFGRHSRITRLATYSLHRRCKAMTVESIKKTLVIFLVFSSLEILSLVTISISNYKTKQSTREPEPFLKSQTNHFPSKCYIFFTGLSKSGPKPWKLITLFSYFTFNTNGRNYELYYKIWLKANRPNVSGENKILCFWGSLVYS